MNMTAMSLRFNVSLSQSLEFCERPWSHAESRGDAETAEKTTWKLTMSSASHGRERTQQRVAGDANQSGKWIVEFYDEKHRSGYRKDGYKQSRHC